eukprot:8427577-Pyramimonas_sp.AAC.1
MQYSPNLIVGALDWVQLRDGSEIRRPADGRDEAAQATAGDLGALWGQRTSIERSGGARGQDKLAPWRWSGPL